MRNEPFEGMRIRTLPWSRRVTVWDDDDDDNDGKGGSPELETRVSRLFMRGWSCARTGNKRDS